MSISRVSPASAVTYIGMNVAGTGFEEQENFLGMLTDYRERFTKFIEDEMAKEEQSGRGHMPHGSEEGTLDLSQLPPFRYESLGVVDGTMLVLPDLMMLVLISIVFYALAFVLFLRYDVR